MASDPLLLTTAALTRAVCRLFLAQGHAPLAEVTLADGHRADILAIGPDGSIHIAELKVSLADLRGDRKWQSYLDWCDRFFWAVPEALAPLLEAPGFAPETAGLIVADAHEAAVIRQAATRALAPARRKALMLRLARLSATRLARLSDPSLDALPLF
jgi:hypothetical protein